MSTSGRTRVICSWVQTMYWTSFICTTLLMLLWTSQWSSGIYTSTRIALAIRIVVVLKVAAMTTTIQVHLILLCSFVILWYHLLQHISIIPCTAASCATHSSCLRTPPYLLLFSLSITLLHMFHSFRIYLWINLQGTTRFWRSYCFSWYSASSLRSWRWSWWII